MIVVDAVDDPVQPGAEPVLGLEMEHHPVQPVLGQGPEQPTGQEQRQRSGRGQLAGPEDEQDAMAGTKMTGGTSGCTRESRSSRSDSNMRGEALSASVRWASTRSHFTPERGWEKRNQPRCQRPPQDTSKYSSPNAAVIPYTTTSTGAAPPPKMRPSR